MNLRVLIADDELMARKRIRRLLEAVPDVRVVAECADGAEVLELLEEGDVDVVLLDVQMPRLTGVDTMGLLGPDAPMVIFTTAHAEYAVHAFDGGAVDYLLKPIEAGRLIKALERARERLGPTGDSDPAGRLPLPTARGVTLINHGAITHVTIDGASVVVHTAEGRTFTDQRLAAIERRLPSDRFLRVHRQALVGLDHLERLEPVDSGGYVAHLAGGATVSVSRKAARALRRRWGLPR